MFIIVFKRPKDINMEAVAFHHEFEALEWA